MSCRQRSHSAAGFVLLVGMLWCVTFTFAAPNGKSEAEIDALVQEAMRTFHIPGISVGIIRGKQIVHLKGYGQRGIGKPGTVNPQTLFSIASLSKAFTSAALAILVDDGKLRWSDKVVDYLPEFQLYDPWVTREITVRDLLIHNSGLRRGAGDLMFWPGTNFSRAEIIANMRYLAPVSGFRVKHAYSNLMYIVAGELIPAITGMSLEDFTDTRILKPLGMQHCASNRSGLRMHANIASPHMFFEGQLKKAQRLSPVYEESLIAGPGGIECSAQSMLKWLGMHLRHGKLANGGVLISMREQARLINAQTVRNVGAQEREWFNTHFKGYALGWSVLDAHGYKWLAHAGGLPGMMSYAGLLPERNVGIVVLTNQQSGAGLRAIFFALMQSYISDETVDWIARFKEKASQPLAENISATKYTRNLSYVPEKGLETYVGTFRDPWFGKLTIENTSNGLVVQAHRSTRLKGKLIPYKNNVFIAQWDDRSLEADAYLRFSESTAGRPDSISLQAVSPLTDFSFDFEDLQFRRIQ